MTNLIVTRHAGLVAWLAGRGITGPVVAQAAEDDVQGRDVYGVLPLHLAAVANSITTVDMPDLIAEQRGKDLTPAEMDAAGARLRRYTVNALDEPTFVEFPLLGNLEDHLGDAFRLRQAWNGWYANVYTKPGRHTFRCKLFAATMTVGCGTYFSDGVEEGGSGKVWFNPPGTFTFTYVRRVKFSDINPLWVGRIEWGQMGALVNDPRAEIAFGGDNE